MPGSQADAVGQPGRLPQPIAVLDDAAGALTRALIELGLSPRTWCDDLRDELAVPQANRCATPSEAVAGARTVLWRLPKAVAAVEEYGQLIASHAAPDVRVIAGGRDKHLSRSMNEALGRHFGQVSASLGHRKARALRAEGPQAGAVRWPRLNWLDDLDLTVAAHGATFSTNRLDRGTSLLVSCSDQLPAGARAIDLGCGSGILACVLARQGRSVTAVDVTWSACDSAMRTAEANGLSIDVQRRDGLTSWTEPVDLIVLNPPFHVGSAKDSEPTRALIAQAGAALARGGELWCVYNAHLPYLDWLRTSVGRTEVVARDRAYVVARSVVTHVGVPR